MIKLLLCFSVAVAAAATHYQNEKYHTPKYSYKYSISDSHTHDMKSHWETRDGDKVYGSYRLVEPDGSIRIVHYTADKHNGFRAVVTREKHGHRQVTVHGKKKTNHGQGAISKVQSHFGGNYKHFAATSQSNFWFGHGGSSSGTPLRFVHNHFWG